MGYKINYGLRKRAGFTLIELLVSVSILLLLMGISFINFGRADQNELLRYGARRLADSLQSIQSFAQSGTLAQYPTAQSYGVHTDLAAQEIILFADQHTESGIGQWDGDAKDARMREALSYTARKGRDVELVAITIAYQDGKDKKTRAVHSIDIAAVPPHARLVFPGVKDAAGNDSTTVERVTFTIKQTATGKTTDVTIYALSGRIDVDY